MEITADHLHFPTNESTPGFSWESGIVRKRAEIVRQRTYKTATRQPTKILKDALVHLFVDCHEPNWDGFGAAEVSVQTLQRALVLTKFAPDFEEIPEVLSDPDGDIAFEWNSGENSLTIAVNAKGEIAFAGFYEGDAQIRGVEKFDDKVPETISRLISRVFGK